MSIVTLLSILSIVARASSQGQCTVRGSMILQPICSTTDNGRQCSQQSRSILQVCIGGVYRSVCYPDNNRSTQMQLGQVACREMGYTGFKSLNLTEPEVQNPLAYYVRCSGGEERLLDCNTRIDVDGQCSFMVELQCTNDMDAVECKFGEVRRIQGSNVLQYCYGRQWRSVCQDFWTQRHTDVVCRQLGGITQTDSEMKYELAPLYFYCTGNEVTLSSCRKGFITNCDNIVSIACTGGFHIDYMYTAAEELNVMVTIPEDNTIEGIYITCSDINRESLVKRMGMKLPANATSTINFTISGLVSGTTYQCCTTMEPPQDNLMCQFIDTTMLNTGSPTATTMAQSTSVSTSFASTGTPLVGNVQSSPDGVSRTNNILFLFIGLVAGLLLGIILTGILVVLVLCIRTMRSNHQRKLILDNPNIANPSYTATEVSRNGKRRFKLQQREQSTKRTDSLDAEQPEEYLTPSPSQRNLKAVIDHEVEEVIYNDSTNMEQQDSSPHIEDIYDDTVDTNQGPSLLIHKVDEVIYNDSDEQPSYDYPSRPLTTNNGDGNYNYVATSFTSKQANKKEKAAPDKKPLSSVYSYAGEDLVATSLSTSQSPEPAIYSSLRSNDIPDVLISEASGTTTNKYADINPNEDSQEFYSKLDH